MREAADHFATERADPQAVGPATLVDRVRAAGYEVPLVQLTLPVSGMGCAACVGRVETALRGVPGVGEAVVDLAAEQARVTVVEGRVAVADLRTAVRAAGYDLPEAAGSAEARGAAEAARAREAAWLRRRVLVGAGLTVPVLLGSFPQLFPWAPPGSGIPGSSWRRRHRSSSGSAGPRTAAPGRPSATARRT